MEKIKRYKLKDGITKEQLLQMGCKESDNLTYICKGAVMGKTKSVKIFTNHEYKDQYGILKTLRCDSEFDIDIAFTENLQNWNDFDNVIVLDSDWCQPYQPFYNYLNGKIGVKTAPKILPLFVSAYNEYMDSLEFLEERK